MRRPGTQPLLGADDLRRLDELFLAAYAAVAEIRTADPLGRLIQPPKVPSLLTESLVALHANRFLDE